MSTTAMTGAGVQLKINTTGSTYVAIAQVKTFQFNGQKWNFDDITNAGSPAMGNAGVLIERTPTTLDAGMMDISGVWLYSDAGQQALVTKFNAGTLVNFKLLLPIDEGQTTTGNEYDFAAFIANLPVPDNQYDKANTFKCSLEINSVITIIPGS